MKGFVPRLLLYNRPRSVHNKGGGDFLSEKKSANKKKRRESFPTPADRLPGIRRGEELPEFKSGTDVYGSYTGTPLYGGQPIQDADDL